MKILIPITLTPLNRYVEQTEYNYSRSQINMMRNTDRNATIINRLPNIEIEFTIPITTVHDMKITQI